MLCNDICNKIFVIPIASLELNIFLSYWRNNSSKIYQGTQSIFGCTNIVNIATFHYNTSLYSNYLIQQLPF